MDKTQSQEEVRRKSYDLEKLIVKTFPKALYALVGYLSGICALPFGAYPFGIALIAAADANAIFIYIGVAISCFIGLEGAQGMLLLGICTAEILLRILVRLTLDYPFKKGSKQSIYELGNALFSEHAGYRILIAAVCAVAFGICFLASGGFLYYDLISLAIMSAVAPAAAYVFYCFFCKRGVLRDLGFLALAAISVYAASPVKFYGVSLAVFGAVFVTLRISHKRGILRGVVTGFVLGAIYSPLLSPAFALCALCGGAFFRFSNALACFCAFFTSVGWGFYVRGLQTLNGFFAGSLCACVLYSVVFKFSSRKKSQTSAVPDIRCAVLGQGELDGIRLLRMNRRMSAISEGLEKLSDFFEDIKLRFPRNAELTEICEKAFEISCAGCSEYAYCRGHGVVESEKQGLCDTLLRNGRVSSEDIRADLLHRCPRLPDILDEINYNFEARSFHTDSTEMFVPDYKALSKLLEPSIEAEEDEYLIDKELSQRVCEAIEQLNIGIFGAMVYGKRRKIAYLKASHVKLFEENKTLIIDALGSTLPFRIDADDISISRCADGAYMIVGQTDNFRTVCAYRQVRARGEREFCGDSLTFFENGDHRAFSLISDGMGSGREAAAVSEICTNFIRSLLGVGRMNDELLGMLNSLLRGRGEGSAFECSATVDLMELDLISGETEFFKSGAAPSYVFRDGSLFKLRSCTMPIGILNQTDVKSFKFTLSEGDVIVMMSDGVTGGKDECPWLYDLLRQNVNSEGLERTADLILKYAIGNGSEDDISLAVMRIERAE